MHARGSRRINQKRIWRGREPSGLRASVAYPSLGVTKAQGAGVRRPLGEWVKSDPCCPFPVGLAT